MFSNFSNTQELHTKSTHVIVEEEQNPYLDMARKGIALAIAATAAGLYTYVVWKRQMQIYKDAKARAIDQVKTIALKVVTGSALAMGVYIYLHDSQRKRIQN